MNSYKNLPETLNTTDCNKYFNEILDNSNNSDKIETLKNLDEIADKQWHTYKILNTKNQDKISNWILENIDLNNISFIKYSITISMKLGLIKIMDFFKNLEKQNLSDDIKLEIENAFKESSDWSNPYKE